MKGGDGQIGQVHGNLCHTIFFNEPSYGFYGFKSSRNHNRLTVLIGNNTTIHRIPFSFYPSGFPHVKCNAVGPADRSRIQIHVVGNEKVTAPITVAPRFSSKTAGPKSGFHSVFLIFSANPSYSPARITDKLLRALFSCAAS